MQQLQIDLSRGLYAIFMQRLEELSKSNNKIIIPFSDVYGKICRNFSITKIQCREVLFLLNDSGAIEIISAHGIRLCK
jgi:hypothetical protein